MTTSRLRVGVLLALLVGLSLRVAGIGWDGGTHLHPDERFLTMVAGSVRIPPAATWFDTARSPGNPHNVGHSFFVYGTLPVLVFRAAGEFAGRTEYGTLVYVQRAVSAAADGLTLLLAALLAFRLAPAARRGEAALLAAVLWAFAPFAIQQARFGTVDTIGAAVGIAAVVVACGAASPRLAQALAAGALVGAAAACKPNLAVTALPVGLLLALEPDGRFVRPRRLPLLWGASGAAAAVAFRVLAPCAFEGPGILGLRPNPKWLANLAELSGMLHGDSWFPPGVQWVDRVPVLEFLWNVFGWATGPALGLLVVLVSLAVVSRALLRGDAGLYRPLAIVLPAAALLLWQGRQFTASVRHAHAWLPLLVAAASAALFAVAPRQARKMALLAVAGTVAAGLAFASIAREPYTRVEASRRIAELFPNGARVAWEYWDDPLPAQGAGVEEWRYQGEPIGVFDHPEDGGKVRRIVDALDRADLVVLSSRRGLGTVARLPDAFPVTSEYYRLLWTGALGFEKAATIERRPRLGPFSFDDRLAEEALSVYDHPTVHLFRRTARWDRASAEALLARCLEIPSGEAGLPPKTSVARGTPPDVTPQELAKGLPSPPPPARAGPLGTAFALARWVVSLELVGLLGLLALGPLAALRPGTAGWLARPLGFALAGLGWSLLGHLVPGFQLLAAPLFWCSLAAALLLPAGRRLLAGAGGAPRWTFLALFALFLAVRAWNPEVFWGEKPMDGAILGAAVRAPRLPLPEPWFAGATLDYYGHGFLPAALLSRASGASPGVAFNLAAATLPALLGSAVVGAGALLAGSAAGGFASLALVLLTGTLAPVFNKGYRAEPLGFNGFWSASRVVPDGINEFPLFTALFADLHAHLLGWAPFGALLLLALWRAVHRPESGSPEDRRGALLLGALLAAVHLTNPWDSPLAGLLAAFALPARPRPGERLRAALEPFVLAGAAGLLAALPTLLSTRTAGVAVMAWDGAKTSPLAWIELWGVPLALLAAAWVAFGPGRDGRERLAFGLALLGVLLAALPDFVVVADRMNSVFKFGLEARILLGLAAGAVVPPLLAFRRGRGVAWASVVAVLAALALVTAGAGATHVAAVLKTRRVPGPRPALDGFAYVADYDPAGERTMEALNRAGGIEPILDPPGDPYSPTLQATMRTGRPTVVGWPWHLQQRRRSPIEIERRQRDVNEVVAGPRDEMRHRLLLSWGVREADVLPRGGR